MARAGSLYGARNAMEKEQLPKIVLTATERARWNANHAPGRETHNDARQLLVAFKS